MRSKSKKNDLINYKLYFLILLTISISTIIAYVITSISLKHKIDKLEDDINLLKNNTNNTNNLINTNYTVILNQLTNEINNLNTTVQNIDSNTDNNFGFINTKISDLQIATLALETNQTNITSTFNTEFSNILYTTSYFLTTFSVDSSSLSSVINITISKNNYRATICIPVFTLSTGSGGPFIFSQTAMPSTYLPKRQYIFPMASIIDNGAMTTGIIKISNTGASITIAKDAATDSFTSHVNSGLFFEPVCIQYPLDI